MAIGSLWQNFIKPYISEGPLNQEIKHLALGLETLLYGGDSFSPIALGDCPEVLLQMYSPFKKIILEIVDLQSFVGFRCTAK